MYAQAVIVIKIVGTVPDNIIQNKIKTVISFTLIGGTPVLYNRWARNPEP